jgi:hypothetical protein
MRVGGNAGIGSLQVGGWVPYLGEAAAEGSSGLVGKWASLTLLRYSLVVPNEQERAAQPGKRVYCWGHNDPNFCSTTKYFSPLQSRQGTHEKDRTREVTVHVYVPQLRYFV